MKNKILIFASLFFLCGIAKTQVKYAVKAGYNNSVMKWDNGNIKEKFDSKSSFYVGVSAEKQFSEKFGLSGELRYTTLGGKYTQEAAFIVDNGISMGTIEIDYSVPQLSIPISAKYYPVKQFSLLGGLNFNFIISPTLDVSPENSINANSDGDLETLKTFNVNPFLGAEYYFKNQIFAEVRYNFGLFNTAKENAIDTYFNYFQIGIGYQFK